MGKFGYNDRKTATFIISDPGADDVQLNLFKAPNKLLLLDAWISVQDAQGAGSAGVFELQNWDTAGTAIKSGASGTIAAGLGGTAVADRLAANVPSQYTFTTAEMADGEWLVCDYQETGDFVETAVTVFIEYVDGEASTS